MMKLATMLSLVAALAVGCGNKDKDKPAKDDQTAQTQPKAVDPDKEKPAKPEEKPAKPEEKPAKPEEKPVAAGDLPAECGEWKDAMAKLASCEKLPPASRDALKQAYDAAAAGWANIPAEGKAGVAQACKAGVDAVKQAATVCTH
jgi:hypothetical protein